MAASKTRKSTTKRQSRPSARRAKGKPGKFRTPKSHSHQFDHPPKAPVKPAKPKRVSALDAAAAVLAEAGKPMRVKELIARMHADSLWTSPGGKTPHATLAAAITREIATKGKEARFKKHDRGLFAAAARGS